MNLEKDKFMETEIFKVILKLNFYFLKKLLKINKLNNPNSNFKSYSLLVQVAVKILVNMMPQENNLPFLKLINFAVNHLHYISKITKQSVK